MQLDTLRIVRGGPLADLVPTGDRCALRTGWGHAGVREPDVFGCIWVGCGFAGASGRSKGATEPSVRGRDRSSCVGHEQTVGCAVADPIGILVTTKSRAVAVEGFVATMACRSMPSAARLTTGDGDQIAATSIGSAAPATSGVEPTPSLRSIVLPVW